MSLAELPPLDMNGENASPAPEAVSLLQEAFHAFNEASGRFSEHFARLENRIQELNVELEETNAKLRANLREKEKVQAYLSTLLESLPVGVLGISSDGAVHSCNKRAAVILERPADELQGVLLTEVLDSSDCRALLEDSTAMTKPIEVVYQRSAQGRRRALRLQIVPTNRQDEGEAADVLLMEDVTDMRRLEHQANRTNRLAAMGEIAMNVAHEIRNPLGSIELFASMLQNELAGDPLNGPLATHICKGVRCVDHIVSNILQFARPQRLGYALFDLNGLLDETLIYAEHVLRLKEIRIEKDYAEKDAMIWADAELLKQMFLNLFLNAVQATPEKGAVGIRSIPNCSTVEVQIWDSGCGFSPDTLGRIFDPFFSTRKRGTGLGLTIVHNIVSAHKGSIEAENRAEGGALFTIVLPKSIPDRLRTHISNDYPREDAASQTQFKETDLCQPEF